MSIAELRRQVVDLEARADAVAGPADGRDLVLACEHPDGHWQCLTVQSERIDFRSWEEVLARAVPYLKIVGGFDLDVVCGHKAAEDVAHRV